MQRTFWWLNFIFLTNRSAWNFWLKVCTIAIFWRFPQCWSTDHVSGRFWVTLGRETESFLFFFFTNNDFDVWKFCFSLCRLILMMTLESKTQPASAPLENSNVTMWQQHCCMGKKILCQSNRWQTISRTPQSATRCHSITKLAMNNYWIGDKYILSLDLMFFNRFHFNKFCYYNNEN